MVNYTLQARAPSLLDLWMQYRFDPTVLGGLADIPVKTIYAMLCNQPADKETAEKVLNTLNRLFHQKYTVDNVHMQLIEPALRQEGEGDGEPK